MPLKKEKYGGYSIVAVIDTFLISFRGGSLVTIVNIDRRTLITD